MEIIQQIAAVLRSLIAQAAPQIRPLADALSDVVLVSVCGVALLLALIVLFSIINAIGALFRPRRRRRKAKDDDYVESPVREAAQRAAASAAAAAPSAPVKRADPVEKIKRETTANVAKVKGESEQVLKALTDERDRVAPELAFAQVLPTTAMRLLAETLAGGDEPALAAAKRRVMSGDFDGARADLRRYAEGPGVSNANAWRNLGALECLSDLNRAVTALERAHEIDPRQFVTLVSLRRLYSGSGRLNEGRDAATAAIPLAADDREQAIALDELGEACMFLKDIPAAHQAFERSLTIVKTLAEREPRNVDIRRDLAIGHFKLARLGGDDGREHLAQSIAAFEKMKASGALAADDQIALKQLKEALVDYDKKG